MAALTIEIPAEYVGLVQSEACFQRDMAQDEVDDLARREDVDDDQAMARQIALEEASQLEDRLRGLHRPSGGVEATVEASLAAKIPEGALVKLAGELQEAVEGIGYELAELRRIAEAVEWFVTLNERADVALRESVLGGAGPTTV